MFKRALTAVIMVAATVAIAPTPAQAIPPGDTLTVIAYYSDSSRQHLVGQQWSGCGQAAGQWGNGALRPVTASCSSHTADSCYPQTDTKRRSWWTDSRKSAAGPLHVDGDDQRRPSGSRTNALDVTLRDDRFAAKKDVLRVDAGRRNVLLMRLRAWCPIAGGGRSWVTVAACPGVIATATLG